MTDQAFRSGDPIPPDAIPEGLLARIGPDAPERGRSLIARAMVPMPPDAFGVALGILARDPREEIAAAAVASLHDVPWPVIEGVVSSDLPGSVLDVYAHVFAEDQRLVQRLITNQAVLDETVRWLAATRRGPVLEAIASNQVRLVREPKIIEALIANRAAPMPVLARVVETAVRGAVDTSHIPGFRPLAEAFFADRETEEDTDATDGETSDPDSPPSKHSGVDDTEFQRLLGGHNDEAAASDTPNKPLWKVVGEMSLPQKVRLAMMGDSNARSILIRNVKKAVSLAVLKSPKISENEIAAYSQNRSLDGEIIRQISHNREWTRHYTIMHNLALNPKTPSRQALMFLRSLRRRDLQKIARAKDVSANLSRSAKALLDRRRG